MPVVRANGVGLFYEETGDPAAPPLVLIMGWGGDHTAWALQLPAFNPDHRVIALDNRGSGQSEVPPAPYTIAGMAEAGCERSASIWITTSAPSASARVIPAT